MTRTAMPAPANCASALSESQDPADGRGLVPLASDSARGKSIEGGVA
jgi:hypothetical protein